MLKKSIVVPRGFGRGGREDQSSCQDEPILENIYLGVNPVTLSRISRTEIGGGRGGRGRKGDTLFNVISFIDERDEARVLSLPRKEGNR